MMRMFIRNDKFIWNNIIYYPSKKHLRGALHNYDTQLHPVTDSQDISSEPLQAPIDTLL